MFPLLALVVSASLAHQSHQHAKGQKAPPDPGADREKRLIRINASYVAKIRPIFAKKCFDCHSDQTTFPWYYKIPGVKQLIDSDIAEAKEHLEMSRDFPFKGHGKPEEDLDEIVETIVKGEMPPWYYRMMHSASGVTDAEAGEISKWAKESRELLFWDGK